MAKFTFLLADTRSNLGAFYDLTKPLPIKVRLISQASGRELIFLVNGPQSKIEQRADRGVATFTTPDELNEGVYRLEMYSCFSNRPFIVRDYLRLRPEGGTFKLSLPGSDLDADDPMLQANTQNADIFADAPYCTRRKAKDNSLPELPIIIFSKDIPEEGATIKNIKFNWLSDECVELPPDLVRDPFPTRFEPKCGADGSGLEQEPRVFILRIDAQKAWESYSTHLPQRKYAGYSSVPYLEIKVQIDYETKFEIANSTKSVLRTMILDPLPQFANWHYGDTHYHSIYTDNEAEFGGPIDATLEVARAVGLEWFFLTDHSWDFTKGGVFHEITPEDKWLKFLEWVPKQQKSDYPLMIPAEEITLTKDKDFLGQLFSFVTAGQGRSLHMLNLAATSDCLIQDHYQVGEFTLSETLKKLDQGKAAECPPLLFAAHPESGDIWSDSDYDELKKSPFFGGVQLFNERITTEDRFWCADVWNYNIPMKEDNLPIDPYQALRKALSKWRDNCLLPAVKTYSKTEPIRYGSILGGSDAHMDFNFALRPVLPFTLLRFTDNAFGKVRTLAYMPEFHAEQDYEKKRKLLLTALKHGRCIVTDGPVVIPTKMEHQDQSTTPLCLGTNDDGQPYYFLKGDEANLLVETETPRESRGTRGRLSIFYPKKVGDRLEETCVQPIVFNQNTDDQGTSDRREHAIPLHDIVRSARDDSIRALYIRVEFTTLRPINGVEKEIGYCCTNPLWFVWE